MNLKALIVSDKDNVANLIGPGKKGESVVCATEGTSRQTTVILRDDIPPNHKFAARDIKAGDPIVKYGLNIGRASANIQQGRYVHVHNIESNRGRGDLAATPPAAPQKPAERPAGGKSKTTPSGGRK